MIEVRLDFDEIKRMNFLDDYIPDDIRERLILFLSHKLNLPLRIGWDAFRDFYRHLFFKEISIYKEEDGWRDYEDYLWQKKEDEYCGVKNNNGVRDDLKLVFVNFNKFRDKHPFLAKELLEFLDDVKEEMTGDVFEGDELFDDMLEIKVVIDS